MRAFVLSGGGNRGPLQVGALRALLENGIEPEMVVGCSAGALNAAHLAQGISLEQIERLAELWRNASKEEIYPGGKFTVLWRLLSGKDSLYDNRNFYAFLQRSGTSPAQRFGDLPAKIPIYVTATHLDTERLHVFGDNPNDRLLDALMASTALPPLHPPWMVDGERYIDGGTVTPLPLRVAIERGATEIFALHIWDEPKPTGKLKRGVSAIVDRSLSTMLRLQAQHDLLILKTNAKIKLHDIRLRADKMPDLEDWSQADRLVEEGYQRTSQYLANLAQEGREPYDAALSPLKRLGHVLAREWVRLTTRSAPPTPSAATVDTTTS